MSDYEYWQELFIANHNKYKIRKDAPVYAFYISSFPFRDCLCNIVHYYERILYTIVGMFCTLLPCNSVPFYRELSSVNTFMLISNYQFFAFKDIRAHAKPHK